VVVTGAGGFTGAHLVRSLAAQGFTVTALHRSPLDPASDLPLLDGVRLQCCGLAELEALPAGCEAVVHAAASPAWPGFSDDAIVRDNVIATRHLLALAERAGCRAFVFLSSMSLYGQISTPVVDEATPMVDPDVYGASKFIGERLLAERRERLPGLALRLPGVVGPGAQRNWLASTAGRLRRGEPATLFNPDAGFNNALHVADLAALVCRVLGRGWQGFDAVVLGARGRLPVRQVVERLAAGMGLPVTLAVQPSPKPAFLLSSDKAIRDWGYDPMEIGALVDRYAREA
jgi:UDP-glucose 4-epimerase